MQTVLNSFIEPLPSSADGVPDWVHLLPVGTFTGVDGRGPFDLGDADELIRNSMKPGRKLPIDINHATDLIAQHGKDTPAVGWIVTLESRTDGIWGRVEWNYRGRQALADRDYGYLSPVFTHPKSKPFKVTQLLRAALTNDPNLTLTSLHHQKHEENSHMEKAMREALGLPETATTEDVLRAAKDKVASLKAVTEQMARIAKAAGLAEDATETAIVTALNARQAGSSDAEKTALEDQIKALNTRIVEVSTNAARKDAEAAIGKAIEDGKIVPALKDRYIARHMKEAADVEAELKLMPSLNAGGLGHRRQMEPSGEAGLSDDDAAVVEAMGLDPKKFAETSSSLQKERL